MHKDSLTCLVDLIDPFDPQEAKDIAFARSWISSGAPVFRTQKPATPDPHLVSHFILIDAKENRILLVDHKNAGIWLAAGGHVDPDEHPTEAARRECLEELGIEAKFLLPNPLLLTVRPTTHIAGRHTDVSFWYALKGSASAPLTYTKDEFHQIRWFSPDEIPQDRIDPNIRRFLQKFASFS